ncbi:alpha-galactosidase [Pseudactinotalea sp. Z1748]|uniref:alpha-galactosidase n=1 Tax=Pseudactinotalea sp. Z1748 TaxID=3413027 RepID=UPI003C7B91E4
MNPEHQIWRLPTKSGEYVVGLTPDGTGLMLRHWGEAGQQIPPITLPRRTTSFESERELLPLETTALGTRSVQSAEIVARRADGLRGARLRLRSDIVVHHGDTTHLTCPLADEDAGLEVDLHIRTSTAHEVVEKWATLRNVSDVATELLRAWGGAFEVHADRATVEVLHGHWSREFTPARVGLGAGELSIGSRQGITSHTYAPVLTVRGDQDPELAHSVALAWSGSWRMSADAVPFTGRVRVAGGPDDESGILTLGPGEELSTPVVAGLQIRGDADRVARAWHDYQRTLARSADPYQRTLTRPTDTYHRPVVYNSWYATTFDVTVDHQLALAQVAADLGAEAFVVDDGWFRGRTSDRAGLGDWDPDPDKFPHGLGPLVRGVLERGMRFGLWVEPEAVNANSDLYRAHPDWVHHARGRPLRTLRNQYVLDLGRPEVEAWVIEVLRSLLSAHEITYLKWDMNRSIEDGGQSRTGGDDWSWRHTNAYYRVLDMIRAEFPRVTVEGCAGGGGRIDLEVLARTDVVWPSDETGPRDRLGIQHGFLSAFPSWTMSSWVTDKPDLIDTDPASLDFRFVVAMAGVLGVGADLLAWDGATRERARELIERYRSVRRIIFDGVVRRHGDPADDVYALQYTVEDATVVLAWKRPGAPAEARIPLGGFTSEARFACEDGDNVFSGAELSAAGVPVRWRHGDCDVIVLRRAA